MSATLEAQLFCDYFNTKSVLYVAGRTHPVDVSLQ
jgi:HrpA-like RNA helicase